jgi:hypothetical protein
MTFVEPWPLTSRSNNCFLNSIFLPGPVPDEGYSVDYECTWWRLFCWLWVYLMKVFLLTMSVPDEGYSVDYECTNFRYLKQFFLVILGGGRIRHFWCSCLLFEVLVHVSWDSWSGQRSRSHKGHYDARHTALWSCTHIPNIIDLSWKTKML